MNDLAASREKVVGASTVRTDDSGNFDELFANGVNLHIEMMSDDTLWMKIEAPETGKSTMLMMMSGKRLGVSVQDDSDV